ncbi:MAG: FAD synthetase family protein [Tidjanibacter sp.]|nr:FAD synthetase family protein [Tidjanibacter sp.]
MRVHYSFDDNIEGIVRPVVTIGSFDGVHIGHLEILKKVDELAQETGGSRVVVTFSPHPREILPGGGNIELLTTPPEKIALLEKAGVDNLIVARFSPNFAARTAEEFVRDFLVERLHIHTLVVGYNHRIGSDGRQTPADHYERLGEIYGFNVVRCSALTLDGGKVSSTVIRGLLAEGDLDGAEAMLGHSYFVTTPVERGCLAHLMTNKMMPPVGRYLVDVAGEQDILEIDEECGIRLESGRTIREEVKITFREKLPIEL